MRTVRFSFRHFKGEDPGILVEVFLFPRSRFVLAAEECSFRLHFKSLSGFQRVWPLFFHLAREIRKAIGFARD